jgi:photosystem II stability/assembly factor-like uncharacterized protein
MTFATVPRRALASIAWLLATTACAADVAWRELGPAGGRLDAILPGVTRTYAKTPDARLFVTEDWGAQWTQLPPSPCGASEFTQLRANGELYVQCPDTYRSRDGGLTWSRFGEGNFNYPQMVFDPFDARHLIISDSDCLKVTTDDGASWRWTCAEFLEFKPPLVFDPARRGRLVGVGLDPFSNFATRAYESLDDGRTWRAIAIVVSSCFVAHWAIDSAGRLYAIGNGCGFHRSGDGFAWEQVAGPSIGPVSGLVAHATTAGRLVAYDIDAAYETIDGGSSWRTLPPLPADIRDIAFDGSGIWAATDAGAYFLTPGNPGWTPRSVGLNATPLARVAPGADGITITALDRVGAWRTLDGGETWSGLELDGEIVSELARNPADARSLAAMTASRRLFASADNGRNWLFVATTPSDPRVAEPVPVGHQPGAAWAYYQRCVPSSFGGCVWRNLGVVRSDDGGVSWATSAIFAPDQIGALMPSPVDARVAMASFGDHLRLTRDAGVTWQRVPATGAERIVADPVDPARWYAYGIGMSTYATTDFGATWTALTSPPNSDTYDLLVDPANPARLLAVGRLADVSVSDDRGATWRRILAASPTVRITRGSPTIDAAASTIVHAAADQGAVELVVPASPAAETVQAIEYFHPSLGHYFLTASPLEIALLDSGHFTGWHRTGLALNVFPAGTTWPEGTSPVCRFYGRPEYGLDTHFYSASPAECQAVIDRFGAAWILETSSAFGVYLPDPLDGHCRAGATPVYRVYNQRPDVNHRYTASIDVREAMVQQGWDYEGYGYPGVAMCAP